MKPKALPPTRRRVRRDRQIQELVHDSYRIRGKLADPTLCPACGALFRKGRWRREAAPPRARRMLCPACHRARDHFPAGYVTLEGAFLRAHREEVMHLLRHVEARETAEHPLQRIMEIARRDGGLLVSTTDPHLARALGEAVRRAYRGKLAFHYNPEQNLLRVHWER